MSERTMDEIIADNEARNTESEGLPEMNNRLLTEQPENPCQQDIIATKANLDAALKKQAEDKSFWGKDYQDDGYVASMREDFRIASAAFKAWGQCARSKNEEIAKLKEQNDTYFLGLQQKAQMIVSLGEGLTKERAEHQKKIREIFDDFDYLIDRNKHVSFSCGRITSHEYYAIKAHYLKEGEH